MKLSLLFLLIFGIVLCQMTTAVRKNNKVVDNVQDAESDDESDDEDLEDINTVLEKTKEIDDEVDELLDDFKADEDTKVQLNDPASRRRRRRRRRRRVATGGAATTGGVTTGTGTSAASNIPLPFTAPQRAAAAPTCENIPNVQLTKCCGIAKVGNNRRRRRGGVGDVQATCGVRGQTKR